MTPQSLSQNANFFDRFVVTKHGSRNAVVMLLITAILWSSSGLFIKLIEWGPLAILGGRSLVATTLFLIFLRQLPLRWTRLQIVGALAYVGTQLTFVWGTKLTAAANVIFLQYTAPLYIGLFGYWFLKERPKRADWASLGVIFCGMLLFFGDNFSFDSLLGNLMGVIAGVTMAIMVLCLRAQKHGNPAQTILLGNMLGAVIGLPFLVQESFIITSVSIVLYLGLFQIGLSLLIYTAAIKHIPALETTLIVTLEPILNPVWVFLVLGELPGLLATVGAVLVLSAIIFRALISASTPTETLTT